MKFFERLFGNKEKSAPQPQETVPGKWDALEKLARSAYSNKNIPQYLRFPYDFTDQESMNGYILDEADGYMCKVRKTHAKEAPDIRVQADGGVVTSYRQRVFSTKGDKVWFAVTTLTLDPAANAHDHYLSLTKNWMFAPDKEKALVPPFVQAEPTHVSFTPMAPLVIGPYAENHRLDEAVLWSFLFRLNDETYRCFKLFCRKDNRTYIVDSYAPGSETLNFVSYAPPSMIMGSFFPV